MSVRFHTVDQRRAERWKYTLAVTMTWSGGEVRAHTTDISLCGMFVETDEAPAVDTLVRLHFTLFEGAEPTAVDVAGKVVRRIEPDESSDCCPVPGVGIVLGAFRSGEAALRRIIGALDIAGQRAQTPTWIEGDRRHAPRVVVGIPIRWGTEDPPDRQGQLLNLSQKSGFVLHSEPALELGATVHLRFELPDHGAAREVRARATVVRSVRQDGGVGMGIALDLSSVTVAERMARFVKSRRRPPSPWGSARRDDLFRSRDLSVRPLWIASVLCLPLALAVWLVLYS